MVIRSLRKCSRSGLVAVAASLALATGVLDTARQAVAAASALPDTVAVCSFSYGLRFSNPLSMRQTSGELWSPHAGRVECFGQLRGYTVDGVGRIRVHGIYGNADEWFMTGGDDCLRGSGSVFFKARIPQVSVLHEPRFTTIRGSYTYRRVGAGWRGTGIARDAAGSQMWVDAIARQRGRGRQDCFTRPLARALLNGRIVLREVGG